MQTKVAISRLTAFSTAITVAASLLLPPGVYAYVAYSNLDASMNADARVISEVAEQVFSSPTASTISKESDVRALLDRHFQAISGARAAQVTITDQNGNITTIAGWPPDHPVMVRTAPIIYGDRTIGAIKVERSLRPLLINSAWLTLFGCALAAVLFIMLRVIPLRDALKSNEEFRRRDKSLAYANMVFKAATEGSLDAIVVVDEQNHVVSHNQHFLELWNIPPDLVARGQDQPLLAAVTAQNKDPDAFLERVKYLYAHPDVSSRDRLDLKDGRVVERYTQTLYGPDHEYLGRIWFFRDVTARERAADALRQSEETFKAIFDNARDGITLADSETKKFTLGNDSICKMLGYTPAEFATLSVADIHPAESLAFVLNEFERLIRGETRISAASPLKRKDGSVLFADVNSALVTIGGKAYTLGIFRDVTERKAAEDAVRRSEEKYRNLVESTTDYIWEVDAQNRYTYYSPKAFALLGYTQDELLGKTPFDVMAPAEAERVAAIFAPIAAAHQPFSLIENTILHKDGTPVVLETSGVPIFDKDGVYCGYRGIERDVTERKRADQATQERLRRTETQLRIVGQVGQAEALLSGDVETLAREITELAPQASGCERTNVWLFNDDDSELRCIDLFEATPQRHSAGMVLRENEFRPELDVIRNARYVDAHDALTDPRTHGYVAGYLKPLGITSMLDASIQASGRTFGLLCFEHVGREHHWEQDEIAFACQLADKIGLAIISRKRREAEAGLQQRDALLNAAAFSAAEFLTAPNLDEAINKSLEIVSKTVEIDRMTVFERGPGANPTPIVRYTWHAPGMTQMMDKTYIENPNLQSPQVHAWRAPLAEGKIVITQVDHAPEDVQRLLRSFGVKSTLIVPITVDGKYWGQVAFDSCGKEREWIESEIEILKALSDLIGSAIQRDRYVKEIADANRIVQNTPTVLYRMRGEPALPMIYVSQNIKLLGYDPAALVASPQLYQSLIHPDDIGNLRNVMEHALERQSAQGVVELRLLTSHGEYRWFENRFTPIRDAAGRIVEIEGLLIDITERKAAEERIALLARTDPLTGLANRSTFIERLRQSFVATRRGAKPFAVLYLDIDRFKDINDTLGHPLGDHLLINVGERLKAAIRETDLVARLGGDEFAILQSDLEEAADAGAIAAKLCATVAKPIHINGNDLRVTTSIGISVYSPDIGKPEDLLARADVALYRAKEEGRDQYRFHTEDLDTQVREEVALAEELRTALSDGQFSVFYQPQVELSTGRIVGMEALIRWNHPTRGLLPPSKFLPVAERTGAITAIGQWVLDQACRQMHMWREAGIAPQTIAVNISSVQIKTAAEFVQFVTDTLAKWQLSPADLELDVTESMLARAALAKNDVLERLQSLGVKISIDDFGTKFSTLDYLKTYRVSRLKIPQSLTKSATHNHESVAMVRTIVGIARELNIEVIAQGVENEAQWSFLTSTSPVTKVQGYYYSEPVPAAGAQALLMRGVITPMHEKKSAV